SFSSKANRFGFMRTLRKIPNIPAVEARVGGAPPAVNYIPIPTVKGSHAFLTSGCEMRGVPSGDGTPTQVHQGREGRDRRRVWAARGIGVSGSRQHGGVSRRYRSATLSVLGRQRSHGGIQLRLLATAQSVRPLQVRAAGRERGRLDHVREPAA